MRHIPSQTRKQSVTFEMMLTNHTAALNERGIMVRPQKYEIQYTSSSGINFTKTILHANGVVQWNITKDDIIAYNNKTEFAAAIQTIFRSDSAGVLAEEPCLNEPTDNKTLFFPRY